MNTERTWCSIWQHTGYLDKATGWVIWGKRLLYWGTPSIYRTVNQPECDVHHSPLSSAELKTESSNTCTPHNDFVSTTRGLRGAVRGSLNVFNKTAAPFGVDSIHLKVILLIIMEAQITYSYLLVRTCKYQIHTFMHYTVNILLASISGRKEMWTDESYIQHRLCPDIVQSNRSNNTIIMEQTKISTKLRLL